jgi:hypothetical protein
MLGLNPIGCGNILYLKYYDGKQKIRERWQQNPIRENTSVGEARKARSRAREQDKFC